MPGTDEVDQCTPEPPGGSRLAVFLFRSAAAQMNLSVAPGEWQGVASQDALDDFSDDGSIDYAGCDSLDHEGMDESAPDFARDEQDETSLPSRETTVNR